MTKLHKREDVRDLPFFILNSWHDIIFLLLLYSIGNFYLQVNKQIVFTYIRRINFRTPHKIKRIFSLPI